MDGIDAVPVVTGFVAETVTCATRAVADGAYDMLEKEQADIMLSISSQVSRSCKLSR